jgi:hypothetical protein
LLLPLPLPLPFSCHPSPQAEDLLLSLSLPLLLPLLWAFVFAFVFFFASVFLLFLCFSLPDAPFTRSHRISGPSGQTRSALRKGTASEPALSGAEWVPKVLCS